MNDDAVLWERLQNVGLANGDLPEVSGDTTPWYVRVMMGVAGWIGALFLLGFIGAAFSFIVDSEQAAWFIGALLCVAAVFIYRKAIDSDFISQFAFAVSLAGQALFVFGAGSSLTSEETAALLFAALQVGLFISIDDVIHRVWSSAVAAVAIVFLFNESGLIFYTPAVVFAVSCWVWMNEFSTDYSGHLLRPLGYGLTLLLLLWLMVGFGSWAGLRWHVPGAQSGLSWWVNSWINAVLIGGTVFWVAISLLKRYSIDIKQDVGIAALLAVAALTLAAVEVPGVAITMTFMVIAYANGNRVLAGLAIATFLFDLSQYYYLLQTTLLHKSLILIGCGLVLLAARFLMRQKWGSADLKGQGDE